jgi:hypothetical protein
MEQNSICTAAVVALSAMLPVLGLPNSGQFAVHDCLHSFADNLMHELNVRPVALIQVEGEPHPRFIVTGPLSADQAAMLGELYGLGLPVCVVEAGGVEYDDGGEAVLAAVALEEELGAAHEPEYAVRDFIANLSRDLGTEVTVQDGVICLPDETYPDSPYTAREDILYDAAQCVGHDRNDQYGEPENSFPQIAALWNAHLGFDLNSHDVAIMLALLKIARMGAGYKRDSYVDAAGYIGIAGELAEGTVH